MPVAVVADVQSVYRLALRLLLMKRLSFTEVHEARDFEQTLDILCSTPRISLAVINRALPGLDAKTGLPLLRAAYPDIRFAVLAGDIGPDQDGGSPSQRWVVWKGLAEMEMVHALHQVMISSTGYRASALGQGPSKAQGGHDKISRRRRNVLSCICRGLANKEIARALGVPESMVKRDLMTLFERFGARNRTELATLARQVAIPAGNAVSGDYKCVAD